MSSIDFLLERADAYKIAAKIERDSTVSYRVFGDSKKLGALRLGADITVGRLSDALAWFEANWPAAPDAPPEAQEDAA